MVDDPLSISRLLISDSNEQEKKQNFILMIFILIAIILSFVLSLYIILIYIFYPKTRNFAFKMVLYLNIADCNFSIAQLLVFANPNFLFDYPTTNSDVICKIQSLMITWFGLSCIIWTSIIAWTLYSTVILNSTNIEDKEGKYITFGFLIPLIASLL